MNNTITWIKNNLHPHGGVRAWPGGQAYPEVSGYLIPTLLRYHEVDLAHRLGDWLCKIQNEDGSFNGLDGTPRTFDTAACFEGLRALGYTNHAFRARVWLQSMCSENGEFWVDARKNSKHIYTLRVNMLTGTPMVDVPKVLFPNRVHYVAYALEGLLRLGHEDYVKRQLEWLARYHLHNGVADYWIQDGAHCEGTDLCATAQLGVLFAMTGMGTLGTLEALEYLKQTNGGITISRDNGPTVPWAAKYYLDLVHIEQLQRSRS